MLLVRTNILTFAYFYVPQALLLAMVCVVHYDLFSLFSNHPYGQRIMYMDNERHQHRPTSEFDHLWIPRPGTDPSTFHSPPRLVIVHDHGSDGDGYWTDSDDGHWTDSEDGTHSNRGTTSDKRSDNQVHRRRSTPDTEVDSVLETTTTEVPNVPADDYDDDSDYVAPGQEWEDVVF